MRVKGNKMKKLFLILCLVANICYGYFISGKYFRLEKCEYGSWQMGYEKKMGYIGHYKANDGESYKIFFGNRYCEY